MKKKLILTFLVLAILAFLALFFGRKMFSEDSFSPYVFPKSAPFAMPTLENLTFPDMTCNITDFGARDDMKTLNTQAFANAMNKCANAGGGHVIVPAGNWLTGAIHLRSNIDLHLEDGATIFFSQNPSDYLPPVFTRFEGTELMNYSPFVYANGCENVAISGNGTLDGQGESWLAWKELQKGDAQRLYAMAENDIPATERIFAKKGDALRPSFVEFVNCKNVNLQDFSLKNSPMWSIHPLYSENVLIKNIKISTNGHNTDGIVIDSSKNILIDAVNLKTGDDSISIKSGLDKDGWRINRPAENIVIQNSELNRGHSSITIGSEMSGGVKNIYINNCTFNDSDQGIRIKTMKGRGGYVENLWVRDITMNNIANATFQLDMSYDSSTNQPASAKIPTIKNIYLENFSASGETLKYAIQINGIEESKAENISISHLTASSEKGVYVNNGRNVFFDQINISAKKKPFFRLVECENIQLQKSSCEKNDPVCISFKAIAK